MLQSSSSISSSDAAASIVPPLRLATSDAGAARPRAMAGDGGGDSDANALPPDRLWSVKNVFALIAWTLAFLIIGDAAINLAFRYPRSPAARPTAMQGYFEYGRSVEGKLRRMVGPTDAASDPVTVAGWLDRMPKANTPAPGGSLGLSVYGMSFSNNVIDGMVEIDPRIVAARYAGPAAPPSHSYACFLQSRGHDHNPVQVFGILASSVKGMLTLTGSTWTFERPSPFTYPRYFLRDGQLQEIRPVIQSIEDLRAGLAGGPQRAQFQTQLATYDRFYRSPLMRSNPTDASAICRMLRRAYAQQTLREVSAEIESATGFTDDPQVGPVLREMVRDFARRTRADGQLPIVLLLQDRPYRDHLYTLLGPTLDQEHIPYVSTHEIVPTSDAANFLSDGHFTPAANHRVSQRMLDVLRANLPSSP